MKCKEIPSLTIIIRDVTPSLKTLQCLPILLRIYSQGWWLLGAGGGWAEEFVLMDMEFQFGKKKKVLDMDGDDGHTIM